MAGAASFSVCSSGFSPTWEAIDPAGNLWLSATTNHVYKLAAADLAGTGALAIAPSMTLRAPVSNATATFSAIGVHLARPPQSWQEQITISRFRSAAYGST